MEEIEVGEYVRTYSKIRKVTNPNFYMQQYIECGEDIIWRNDILKHSKNIIDLIEVGDIVRIQLNEKTGATTIFCFESQKQIDILNEKNCHIIETIVTKEQFASMEYKVEENKEYVKNKRFCRFRRIREVWI